MESQSEIPSDSEGRNILTPEQVAEYAGYTSPTFIESHEALRSLLAESEDDRAQLRAELDRLSVAHAALLSESMETEAELDRLREALVGLVEAVEDACGEDDWLHTEEQAVKKAREALDG